MTPFARGLHEHGDHCYAYLQPDGSWGWSNAGLVLGDGASLLVDTLFDLKLTAAMLDAMAPVSAVALIEVDTRACWRDGLPAVMRKRFGEYHPAR